MEDSILEIQCQFYVSPEHSQSELNPHYNEISSKQTFQEQNQSQCLHTGGMFAKKDFGKSLGFITKTPTNLEEILENQDQEDIGSPCFSQQTFTQQSSFLDIQSKLTSDERGDKVFNLQENPRPEKMQDSDQMNFQYFLGKCEAERSPHCLGQKNEEEKDYIILEKTQYVEEQKQLDFQGSEEEIGPKSPSSQNMNDNGRQMLEEDHKTDEDSCYKHSIEIHQNFQFIWHNDKHDWKKLDSRLKLIDDIFLLLSQKNDKDFQRLQTIFYDEFPHFESKQRSPQEMNLPNKTNGFLSAINEFWQSLWTNDQASPRRQFRPQPSYPQKISGSRGSMGLRNLGQTCYMNSLFQCLYHVEPFRKALYEEKKPFHCSLDDNLANLYEGIENKNFSQVARQHQNLVKEIFETRKEPGKPGDSSVLFRAMLEELSKGSSLEHSPYTKMFFGGQLIKTLKCQGCLQNKEIHETMQIFQVQDIHFSQDKEETFFKPLKEKRFCPCNKLQTNFDCLCSVTSLPEVLVIKIHDTVDSKTHVKPLRRLCLKQSASDNKQEKMIEYELIAAILNFYKGENGFHSIALVLEEGEKYYVYDDEEKYGEHYSLDYHPQLLFYIRVG